MALTSTLQRPDTSVRLQDLAVLSDRMAKFLGELRLSILTPRPRKVAPTFSSTQVAALCGLDRTRLNYLVKKGELPCGKLSENGRVRLFTLAETRQWIQSEAPLPPSPLLQGGPGQGKVLISANFKGGSTKTTTAMCLAQGLTLRGRKVLLIDLDPQGSLTELCGFFVEQDVVEENTVLPFIYAPDTFKFGSLIQSTYWDGIDVIPASPTLFSAEFFIPAQASKANGKISEFQFWDLLARGIAQVKEQYDYVIIDSAPSLSYLTINGLMASDAIIMPLVPENLDFVSSITFWGLYSDMVSTVVRYNPNKAYDFIQILLSRVDTSPASNAPQIRKWAQLAYGAWVSPIEIPASSVASTSALLFSTLYDVKWEGSSEAYKRVRGPMDAFCASIDDFYTLTGAQK